MTTTIGSNIDVCLVMRQFYPVLAGAAERFRRYAPGLQLRGVNMTAIVRCPFEGLSCDERLQNGPRVLRVPIGATVEDTDSSLFKTALKHLETNRDNRTASILQTNLVHPHTRKWIRRIQATGRPAVWVGTMMEDEAPETPWWRIVRARLKLRFLLGGFDAFVVGSTVMRDWLARGWISASRIQVIGHGVDLNRFHPVHSTREKEELRIRFGLPSRSVIALFVGTITARKGVHFLLEAWERLAAENPDAHLVVVGQFDRPTVVHKEHQSQLAEFQGGVRSLLENLMARKRVTFLEEISAIADLMRACDFLVLPSEREGVPNVVLEAMSCGLPCIITPFAGMPTHELGESGVHFFAPKRQPEPIALAMANLVENEAMRHQMSASVAQHARLNFNLEQSLDAYATLYHSLLGMTSDIPK